MSTAVPADRSRPAPAPAPALIAEVTRRDTTTGQEVVESTHLGHVVLVGPDGSIVASLGDPQRVTFVRSAVKILQAKACLDIVGEQGDELSSADLAIGQASHRGEPRHLDAVTALLSRSGLVVDDLTTPEAKAQADAVQGRARVHHNCSGKHALFAYAGAALGCKGPDLLDPSGPLQSRLLQHLEVELGPAVASGIDGCGAPAIAVPLVRLAEAYQRLQRDPGYARLVSAGTAHPGLVGGEGRLETALLSAGVTAKNGAEGVFAASWVDDAGAAWGLAAKCEDGADRGVDAAVVGVLSAAGVIAADLHELPAPLGGGEPAGSVRPVASLDLVGTATRPG